MEEIILSPIGLVFRIIAAPKRINANITFGYTLKLLKHGGFYKKLHLPIQSRSPPLFACY
jgi:hypothetical protein